MDEYDAIKECIIEIDTLKNANESSSEFKEWRFKTEDILIHIFGNDSDEVERFREIENSPVYGSYQKAYIEGLESAKAVLNSALAKFERNSQKKKEDYGFDPEDNL